MRFYREITLRDGRLCILKNAEPEDARAYIAYFEQAHGETDYLTSYPGESRHSEAEEAENLAATRDSDAEAEICAWVDGVLAGSAGNNRLREREKLRHRAEFGISILRQFWGLGIGTALTEACIELASRAGFLQLELEAVAENSAALRIYEKAGFVEYGRNPRGFRTRQGTWQEIVLMRREL